MDETVRESADVITSINNQYSSAPHSRHTLSSIINEEMCLRSSSVFLFKLQNIKESPIRSLTSLSLVTIATNDGVLKQQREHEEETQSVHVTDTHRKSINS